MTPTPAAALVSAATDAARGLAAGAADVMSMLRGIGADPRVSNAAKVEAAAVLAYLASGKARIPRFLPVVGRIDDLAVAAFALRRLLGAAGEPVLRSHWKGSGRGLAEPARAVCRAGDSRRAAAGAGRCGAAASALRETRQ